MELKRILTDDTFVEKVDTTNKLIAELVRAVKGTNNNGSGVSISSDNIVAFAENLGLGIGTDVPIGKQFVTYKENSLTASVTLAETTENVTRVEINEFNPSVFLSHVGHVEEHIYVFTFDGAVWHDENNHTVILADYGVTLNSGRPIKGDIISIVERADLQKFDLVQINPSEYQYPFDSTNGKGDYAMMLSHDIYITMPFCGSKLLYYAKQELPAGTYKFAVSGTTVDGLYKFTTSGIPKFGGFRFVDFTKLTNENGSVALNGAQIAVYSPKFTADTTTPSFTFEGRSKMLRSKVIETVALEKATAEDVAIDLGVFHNSAGHAFVREDGERGIRGRIQRMVSGDNRYSKSWIHKYLNSDAPAVSESTISNDTTLSNLGGWFYYTDELETTPTNTVLARAGYAFGFGKDFLDSVQTTRVKIGKFGYDSTENIKQENIYEFEYVDAKFFLPSTSEVGNTDGRNTAEGAKLDYYKLFNQDTDRRKLYNSNYAYWWSRSSFPWGTHDAWYVHTSGSILGSYARDTLGVAPACIIKKSS